MRYFILSVFLLTSILGIAQAAKSEDISGLYSFVRSGETLQVSVQPDHSVTGYVSRLSDDGSGQLVDAMFERASLNGDLFEFKTKKVHGEWFEFKGHVQRGKATSRDDEGYFVIRGTLTSVKEGVNGKPTPLASQVEFTSFPQGM
jgi:hypothetical protein